MNEPLPSGMSTLLLHHGEAVHPHHAHVEPIYQTATFGFPDVETGRAIVAGEVDGHYYTRLSNPNARSLAVTLAALEGLDLLRADPAAPVAARMFASGMAAISAVMLSRLKSGDTIIAQGTLYGGTYGLLTTLAPQLGIAVAWVEDPSPEGWGAAFAAHPGAKLAWAESPANPAMTVVDLRAAAGAAHAHGAWLVVDNTFATPYCQRPLTLGADVVVHSTTKYISGHGAVVGGAAVSRHADYVHGPLHATLKTLGGSPSPFDCWLTSMGLKTFELRMGRHCENALALARWLEAHPAVARVNHPGLESHPGHAVAARQMSTFGGMLSFELKGGQAAARSLLERVRLIKLAVSLGSVDSLIQHPAGMTHAHVPHEARLKMGISDGLVRLSVGIENLEDLLADLERAF